MLRLGHPLWSLHSLIFAVSWVRAFSFDHIEFCSLYCPVPRLNSGGLRVSVLGTTSASPVILRDYCFVIFGPLSLHAALLE